MHNYADKFSVIGNIKPFWTVADVSGLPYKFARFKPEDLGDQYVKAGHSAMHMTVWNCFEVDTLRPDLSHHLRSAWPDLMCIGIAVNKLTPGQYLPPHYDLYQRYRQIHAVSDTACLCRILVMLEDSQMGQILQIENTVYCSWKAGDWFDWPGAAPHASYNFSLNDRYAWQVTGILS